MPDTDQVPVIVKSYAELLNVCRDRARELEIDYAAIDAMTGSNAVSKLLAPPVNGGHHGKRHFSPQSFDACMEALGLGLVLVENVAKTARLKAFCEAKYLKREGPIRTAATPSLVTLSVTRDFLRQIGRKGGAASARNRRAVAAKKQRISEIARRNALKRWRKRPAD